MAFLLALIPVIPAEAAVISGTVTGPGGVTRLAGIEVTVWLKDGDVWYSYLPSITDAAGQHTIDGYNFYETDLTQGVYRLEFHDPSGSYAMESYNDALSFWQGDEIVISNENQVVTGIDASLSTASSISGNITGPGGSMPLENIEATAWIWDGGEWTWLDWGYSDRSGNYTIEGLPAGTYRIEFSDSDGIYATESYDDTMPWNASTIVVASNAVVQGIDASLGLASHITGTVTGSDGSTPLEYIEAAAYIWSGTEWVFMNWADSDTNGYYEIGGLPSGTCQVDFSDYDDVYAYEVFNNGDVLGSGSNIVLSTAQTAGGINISMKHVSPVVVGFYRTGSHAYQVDFTGISGTQYILQETSSLQSGWSGVGSPIVCGPGTNHIPIISDENQAFWRIMQMP